MKLYFKGSPCLTHISTSQNILSDPDKYEISFADLVEIEQ